MENDYLIVPVLDGDDSDLEEMLEVVANDENENENEPSLEQQLASFRQQWHKELGQGQRAATPVDIKPNLNCKEKIPPEELTAKCNSPVPVGQDVNIPSMSESLEEKAKYLFLQGVRQERIGNMYEAVMFYKHAMQLVPDVENRVQESETNSRTGSNQVSDDEENNNEPYVTVEKDYELKDKSNVDNDADALAIELQSLTTNELKSHCQLNTPQTATHISSLPVEVLLLIFRWVVSADLDIRSLEQLAMVCRGFYVCARDNEIWKSACNRVWGKMVYLNKEYISWRDMYVECPHPRFSGIYISRVTYVRHGEPSMDPFYRPWHLVEYHRFLRVFTDGAILLVSSADDPQSVVSRMYKSAYLSGKMMGRYRIVEDMLTAVLEKEKVKELADMGRRYIRHRPHTPTPESEQTFHLELKICSHGRRPNVKLEWRHYACHTRYRSTGNVTVTDFDMNHQFYPFHFSRVKSYTRTSDTPL